ncbi:lipopolysaccharide assembly protein LapB [Sporosarcina pasteurii]|uniref:Tetratricopeptide repeat protein n=1 Tax=Sporosarcina pasteurii TaxID=1474 RepID=A0A380BKJ0_SPOPA|nr:tetratricopeptide repeat protein [Sporosarcina pasteurii]MDS9470829.1 tetratricopeptide repeat protein [Sporosarcina pasteurii]QBQ05504.1 tetratricopeptide repeat protein [Sporosarcina pasteurii]SUJ02731.1 tetratricopeptide repeat protein [Sporosarcina pasteurii]
MEQLQEIERIIQEGDMEALEAYLNQLKATTDLDLIYEVASILAAYGFMKEANDLYETLLVHLPDEAQLKIDRANTLIELGEEDEALLLLNDIKKDDDEYVQALLVLADYYQLIGLAETAIDKIKEAHELLPEEPIIKFAYAELLLESGRYAEAARYYLEIKEQVNEIGDVSITSRLAETYSAGGAYEEAIPYYEEMLQDTSPPDILFGAAFAYYQVGNPKRAIPLLDELIGQDPDYYSAYMLAGQAQILAGEDQKAYDLFKAGIVRDEFDKELQLSAGKCALKLGYTVEAESYLKEALVLDPEYIEALVTLASLYHTTERDEELIELLTDANEYIEDIPTLHAFLAYAYERTELYDNAYESFKKAYSGMKEEHEFLASYASFLVEEGRRSEAIKVADQLVKLFPDDPNWRAFLESQND